MAQTHGKASSAGGAAGIVQHRPLATAVALKMGDGLAHNLQNLQNQLQQKRYGI